VGASQSAVGDRLQVKYDGVSEAVPAGDHGTVWGVLFSFLLPILLVSLGIRYGYGAATGRHVVDVRQRFS
jgi:hypothetical protein